MSRELDQFPGYSITDQGVVISHRGREPKTLKPSLSGGYLKVDLYRNRRRHTVKVHTLVAQSWLGARPTPRHQINHIDGCKTNNAAANLEWVTSSGNTSHAYRVGLVQGKRYPLVLTRHQAEAIRNSTEPRRALADRFKCSLSTVSAIRNGKAWRDAA